MDKNLILSMLKDEIEICFSGLLENNKDNLESKIKEIKETLLIISYSGLISVESLIEADKHLKELEVNHIILKYQNLLNKKILGLVVPDDFNEFYLFSDLDLPNFSFPIIFNSLPIENPILFIGKGTKVIPFEILNDVINRYSELIHGLVIPSEGTLFDNSAVIVIPEHLLKEKIELYLLKICNLICHFETVSEDTVDFLKEHEHLSSEKIRKVMETDEALLMFETVEKREKKAYDLSPLLYKTLEDIKIELIYERLSLGMICESSEILKNTMVFDEYEKSIKAEELPKDYEIEPVIDMKEILNELREKFKEEILNSTLSREESHAKISDFTNEVYNILYNIVALKTQFEYNIKESKEKLEKVEEALSLLEKVFE